MNLKMMILMMILVLSSVGVVAAHPNHGTPIEVPSEPAEPDPKTTDTTTSSSDSNTDTKTGTSTTSSGSTQSASGQTETATPSHDSSSVEYDGEVALYPGDSEDINSSWLVSAIFAVAAGLGAVGVYYKGDRLGP